MLRKSSWPPRGAEWVTLTGDFDMRFTSFLLWKSLPAEKAGMKGGRFCLNDGNKVATLHHPVKVLAEYVAIETHSVYGVTHATQVVVAPNKAGYIHTPEEAALMAQKWGADPGSLLVFTLNTKKRINAVLGVDSLDKSVFKTLMRRVIMTNAAAILPVYASLDDTPTIHLEHTQFLHDLYDVCALLGIQLLDLVLAGLRDYVSIRESGLMPTAPRKNILVA